MLQSRLISQPASLAALLLALSLSDALAQSTNTAAARPDPWKPLRPLLGKWEGEANGEPGSGRCEREYAFALNKRFIRVTNKSTYSPQEKNPKGEVHEDAGYISYDRAAKKFVLRQFHTEGFVNQYVNEGDAATNGTLVFVSTAIENIPAGWRARETYKFVSADEFIETFELAEPGKEFKRYSETKLKRKK